MQATVLFQGSGAADMQRSGRVTTVNDATIGRTALRLDGSPASACLRLPRRQDASLGAPGRFLYLQLRLEQGGLFAVHANMTAGDRSVHRATISNLGAARGEAARAKRSGGVQVRTERSGPGCRQGGMHSERWKLALTDCQQPLPPRPLPHAARSSCPTPTTAGPSWPSTWRRCAARPAARPTRCCARCSLAAPSPSAAPSPLTPSLTGARCRQTWA